MSINRNNYELYFLDYREGRITATRKSELMVFLEENPDLQQEFYEFEIIKLPEDDALILSDKSALKKDILPYKNIESDNFEEKIIASIEGDLRQEEENELHQFLKLNPKSDKQKKLFKQTKLEADLTIVYENKQALKKSPVLIFRRKAIFYFSSAAAIILLFFGIQYLTSTSFNRGSKLKRVSDISGMRGIDSPLLQSPETYIIIENRQQTANDFIALSKSRDEDPDIGKLESFSSANIEAAEFSMDLLPVFMITRMDSRLIVEDLNNEALAQSDHNNEIAEDQKKSLFSRVFTGLFKGLKSSEPRTEKKDKKFDFWALAEIGVNGYNTLTDNDVVLETERNDKGKVSSYELKNDEDNVILKRSAKHTE